MQNPISLILKSTYQIHEQPLFSIIHKKLVFKLTFLWAISHLYSLNMTIPHQTLLIRLIKNKLRHTHKHAYFGRNLQQPKQIIQYFKCNKHNSLIIFIKKLFIITTTAETKFQCIKLFWCLKNYKSLHCFHVLYKLCWFQAFFKEVIISNICQSKQQRKNTPPTSFQTYDVRNRTILRAP